MRDENDDEYSLKTSRSENKIVFIAVAISFALVLFCYFAVALIIGDGTADV